MKSNFTSTVAGATIFIAVISLFSRSLGFLREIIFAGYFGTSDEFDLYLVAAVLPLTILAAFTYIAQNYFIPAYNNYINKNQGKGEEFYFQKLIIFFFSGVVVGILLFVISETIINLYLKDTPTEVKTEAQKVFIIFLLSLPFSAGTALITAYLNAIFEFRYPSQSVLFLNISTILFVILLSEQMGVLVIAIGFLTGTILQFIYLVIRAGSKYQAFQIKFTKEKLNFHSFVSFPLLSIVLIEIISQLYSIIDRYYYTNVSQGGIAALNYAQTIFLFPVSILSMALGTVIFPKISSAVQSGNKDVIKSLFEDSVLVTLFLFVPVTMIFIFHSDEIVTLLFERGSFDEISTEFTSTALKYFAISLTFYGVYAVINKIFYSINLTISLLIITIVGLIIKALANHILVGPMGHYGLALGTTVSFIAFFLICFSILNNKLHLNFVSKFFSNILIIVFTGSISIITVQILSSLFDFAQLISGLIRIILFLMIYTLMLFFIEHPSVKLFINVFKRWMNPT